MVTMTITQTKRLLTKKRHKSQSSSKLTPLLSKIPRTSLLPNHPSKSLTTSLLPLLTTKKRNKPLKIPLMLTAKPSQTRNLQNPIKRRHNNLYLEIILDPLPPPSCFTFGLFCIYYGLIDTLFFSTMIRIFDTYIILDSVMIGPTNAFPYFFFYT